MLFSRLGDARRLTRCIDRWWVRTWHGSFPFWRLVFTPRRPVPTPPRPHRPALLFGAVPVP
eukprot:6118600-Prymnesium_polylepis.1